MKFTNIKIVKTSNQNIWFVDIIGDDFLTGFAYVRGLKKGENINVYCGESTKLALEFNSIKTFKQDLLNLKKLCLNN